MITRRNSYIYCLFFVLSLAGCSNDPAYNLPIAIQLNSSNFDSLIVNSDKVVLAEIFSSHSSVTLSTSWVIDSLYNQKGSSIIIAGIDVESSDILWKRFPSDSLPRYILFAKGKIAETFVYDNILPSPVDTLVTFIDYVYSGINAPLPHNIITLDNLNFDSLTNVWDRVSMVEFFSPQCHFCAEMESTMIDISERYSDSALIGKVNILTDNTLKNTFGVRGVPTFLFLKSGKEVRRIVGAVPEIYLTMELDRLLSESD
ncbi:MAG: hypothetical protein GX640_08655 [Fibrobacter sp.]|nr:hypothetical protein [Fibrobacter sp.]